MLLKAILLLLPAVALGGINIKLTAGNSEQQRPSVQFEGESKDIISDTERATFKITDEELKDAAKAAYGGRPDHVYVKSPTPWNDLYKSLGWPQVQRVLTPENAYILGIWSEPVVVSTQEFINNSSVKGTYNAGISQTVEDSFSNTWRVGGDLTLKQEITYGVEFGGGKVGGSTSVSFSSSFGRDYQKSHKVTVGSTSGVQVELAPGQAVVAVLTATRGTMEVRVDYSATLIGTAAVNFADTYENHHFWGYDINACLQAANKPTSIDSTETIKIGFYTDAKIEIRDKATSKTRMIFDVPALS